jgi:hypothetical protein
MNTFTFAGFSRTEGVLKFRTANDPGRAQMLFKYGDTDINMRMLPTTMTKNDTVKFVLANLDRWTVDAVEATALLKSLIKDESTVAKPKTVKKPKTVAVHKNTVKVAEAGDFVYKTIPGTNRQVKYEKDTISPKEAGKLRAEFMKQLKAVYEAN